MKIELHTKNEFGRNRVLTAKEGVSIEDVLEVAEEEMNSGYATYAVVLVNGKVYAEYES